MHVVHASARPGEPRRCFFLGADLGQANDPSACIGLERVDTPKDLTTLQRTGRTTRLRVIGIRRLELGMPYPAQVAEIGALLRRMPVGWRRTELICDRTGVGRAVYDEFRRVELKPIGVTITAGTVEERDDDGGWRVSKSELVGVIAALLHRGDLDIPAEHPLAPVLAGELRDFQVGYTATGAATFSARSGAHDDLVLACAIACWRALRFDRGAIRIKGFQT